MRRKGTMASGGSSKKRASAADSSARPAIAVASGKRIETFPGGAVVNPNLFNHPPGTWQRTVELDIHGVWFDWLTPFCAYISQVTGRTVTVEQIMLYHFGYQGNLSISREEFYENFNRFASDTIGGYGGLNAYVGMVEALKTVLQSDLGIKVRIRTYTPDANAQSRHHQQPFGVNPAQGVTLNMLERFVRENNLSIDLRKAISWTPGHLKPFEMADEFRPLLVEDHGPTAVSAVDDVGIGAILVTQPYNRLLSHPWIVRYGDPAELGYQDRAGLGDLIIEYFARLEDAGVLAPRGAAGGASSY